MKLRTLLYSGFGVVIGVMLIMMMIVIAISKEQNNTMNELVQERYEKVRIANEIRKKLANINSEMNQIVYSQNEIVEKDNLREVEQSYVIINNSLETLKKDITIPEVKDTLLLATVRFEAYRSSINKMIGHTDVAGTGVDIELAEREREQVTSTIESMINIQENAMVELATESEKMYERTMKITTIATILGVFLGVGLALLVIRIISTRLTRLRSVMKQIQHGAELYPKIDIIHKDEIGEIAEAFNEMSHALEVHERNEKKLRKRLEKETWLKSSLAEVSTMSQGIQDLGEIGTKFVSAISKMVEANQAVLYKKDNNRDMLTKLAAYAFNQVGQDKITIGEGLVGQCALERQPLLMKQVPNNYLKISSGLGETNPFAIFILPITVEEELVGVLELAKLTEFTPEQVAFLEQAAIQLGITMNRIERHMQIQELLEESQTLNEELQTQSEELQTQQEELRTMNDELEAQYNSSEQKTRELEEIKDELVQKNEEVLKSSQYKSEFLANMSHELRTPLNSLIILAQMLTENKDGNLDEKQIEYTKTIHSSGNDLLRLINDILDLSKVESGKMELAEGEVVVSDILTSVERQFGPVVLKKGLDFSIVSNSEVPTILYTDEQRLFQILKNLVSNAIKFTEQGSVQLVVEKAYNEESSTEYITFSVTDTGIGIDQKKHSLVFEAFMQADGTTSRKYGGTGLGLSISRELAKLLNGFIKVKSVEGEGSTFTLFLPLTVKEESQRFKQEVASAIEKPQQELNQPKREGINALAGKKILVVDDDMRNIFALTSALEEADMNVVFSENGKEALSMLKDQTDIDLVLMDIMMPEMDGYEAMRQIRKMPDYESLPIIALTAKAMMNDRQKCMDAGASDYISKPVNLEQLFSLLQVWLHK